MGDGIGPDISADPTSVDFSYVLTGTTSAPEIITITNEGNDSLAIGTISLTGTDLSQFSIAGDNASSQTLAPGASANVSVTFTPASTGAKSAYLTIPSNDPDENPLNIILQGKGTEGPLAPDISVSPPSIDFGDVPVGTDSATHNVTISNDGTADLIIGDLTINNSPFTISSGNISNQTLAPDTSANVTLIYSPTAAGTQSANLTIPSNDPDEAEIKVPLSGNGIILYADLAITKTDSPDPVATNGNLSYIVTVTNNGPGNASGANVIDNLPGGTVYQSATASTGSTGYASGNVTWDIGSLNNGASANLTIVVTAPLSAGTITNTATVSGSETDPLALNNTASTATTVLPAGSLPDITVTPMLIDFGTVEVNSPGASANVTVTNDGIADLIIGTLTIDNPRFAISSGNISGQTLAAGASANITIVFNPAAIGLQTASLIIPSNDPDESSVTVTLIGTGTAPDITVVPLTVNFGQVQTGASSPAKKVTVTNDGTSPLVIGNLTINNGRFTISSGNISGQTLLPGASAEITLVFRPAITGGQTATLSIPSNDPDENPVNVALSGMGTSSPGPGPNPPEPTPTPTPTSEAGPQLYFTVDFLGKITQELADSSGRPIKSMEAPSPDGMHLVEIEAGTGASDNAGSMITLIEIRETAAPALPENTQLVGKAYEFKPSGTTFDKAIKLTLGYNVSELPDNVTTIGAAYYSSGEGWVYLETETGGVAELGKLTAPVNHFTVFAVLAKVTPAPAPEPEPFPEPEPEPQPGPEIIPASFFLSNLSITPSEYRVFDKVSYIVRTGEEAVITADVTNNGGQPGSYTVVLVINGTERERKEITLQAGQTQTVSFTATDNEPGTYTVLIGSLTGDFLSELWINWWLIAGSIGALVLLIWLVWYIIQRRKKARAVT